MARPDGFVGPQRTLNAFEMTEPVFEVGDMVTNALIILLSEYSLYQIGHIEIVCQ
jgi:hypothetical protein